MAALLLFPAGAFLGGCAGTAGGGAGGGDLFAEVKPVLEYYCIECHNSRSGMNYGGLNLETGRAAKSTGRHAPVILPGRPEESLLYIVLRLGHEEALGMPPSPDKISDPQLASIRKWIKAGAPWPEGPEGRLQLPR